MGSRSRKRRRSIVQRLREEGKQAAFIGKHKDTCPYEFEDKSQWLRGYKDGLDIMNSEDANPPGYGV